MKDAKVYVKFLLRMTMDSCFRGNDGSGAGMTVRRGNDGLGNAGMTVWETFIFRCEPRSWIFIKKEENTDKQFITDSVTLIGLEFESEHQSRMMLRNSVK